MLFKSQRMQTEPSSTADTFLASTRKYLSLPADPLERQRAFKELKSEWSVLFRELLQKANEEGAEAWFALGHGYGNGWGTARDRVASAAWFRKAANAGHDQAMVRLAMILTRSDEDSERKEGIDWLNRSADLGNASAMVHLGFSYREGQCVQTDLSLAESWFIRGYEAGDTHAAVHVGRLLAFYADKPKEALHWFHLAAEAEQTESYVSLAMLYDDHRGGWFDPAKAVLWYQRVADEGRGSAPRAMLELARHYRDGVGVSADKTIAQQWIEKLLETAREGSEFYRGGMKLKEEMSSDLL